MVDTEVVPIIVKSIWTPEAITATIAAVGGILTILGGILIQLRNSRKSGETAGAKQDAKLDNITLLVDGRYGEVLKEIAGLRRLVAEQSGLETDMKGAVDAQLKADEQAARVTAAAKVVAAALDAETDAKP